MADKNKKCCCSENATGDLNLEAAKSTVRDDKEKAKLINRLSRIEGQIRGLKGMVDEDRYCIDIINQAVAVNSALNSFTKELLSRHINTCIKNDVANGDSEKLEELILTIQKLMK